MTALVRPRAHLLRRQALALTAAVVVPLTLAGCTSENGTTEPGGSGSTGSAGSSGSATAPSESAGAPEPTGFEVPEGVELTEPGSELSLGEPAQVAVEPDRARGTVLSMTVEEIQRGRTEDLNSYVLTERAESATPYYVDVSVTNEGPGSLGDFAVPLFGQFDDTALVRNTTFATTFDRCPSTPLPRQFGPERSVERCLVFLVPDGGALQGVAFARAGSDPIAWSGSITPPPEQDGGGNGGNGGNGGGGGNGGNG